LRSTPGSATLEHSLNDGPIGGRFRFSASDPFAGGDDGGTVLKAPNGYWIRQYPHDQEHPIELAWFRLARNEDLGPLLLELARRHNPDLFVRMPDGENSYRLGHIDLSGISTTLHLRKGSGTTTLVQNDVGVAQGSPESRTMLHLAGYKDVLIDRGIRFVGRHDQFGQPHLNCAAGLVDLEPTPHGIARSLVVRADFDASPCFGLNHVGGQYGSASGRVQHAVISGSYYNSGLRINAGVMSLEIANVTIEDPMGLGAGYDPKSRSSDIRFLEKHHGAWLQNLTRLTGNLVLRHGGASWFMSQNGRIGASPTEPFVISDHELGRLADGTIIPPTQTMLTQTGKIDGLIEPRPGGRYLRVESDGRNMLQYGFILEATPESPRDNYFVSGMDVVLHNVKSLRPVTIGEIQKLTASDGSAGKGRVRGNRISGTADSVAVFDSYNTLQDLAFGRLYISRHPNFPENLPTSVRLNDCVVNDGGTIRITAGNHIELDGLAVRGSAREFLRIDNATEPEFVEVSLSRLSAPAGSLITAARSGFVKLTMDGQEVALPYRVAATAREGTATTSTAVRPALESAE
jgi:hypothetical protein